MPRQRDTPCSRCGTLMWSGKGSLSADKRVCHPCRRVKPAPYGDRSGGQRKLVKTCEHCSAEFASRRNEQRYCSLGCKNRAICVSRKLPRVHPCVECGKPDSATREGGCCSRECRLRGKSGNTHRRRASRYGVEYEDIVPVDVFIRDRWRCGLCKRAVNPKLRYPHPMSVSLDHILPMSRGGGHTYANVQCAHLKCNMNKGAGAGEGEQLALVG